MTEFAAKLTEVLAEMEEANKQGAPTRTRQLSLAITKLEESILWLGHVGR